MHSGLFAQNADSTADGYTRGKTGLFFKKYFYFKNKKGEKRYKREEKSSAKLAFPFDSDGYKLVFEDQFDSLNHLVWQVGQPWGRFHLQFPHQYYGDSEVFTENGILHLQNKYSPKEFQNADSMLRIPYGTGLINTYYSNSFTYGYFAIRSRNPSGPATWPAFWLTGKYHWPPEIDIFEMYGKCNGKSINNQTMTLHFGKIENQTKKHLMRQTRLNTSTDSQFHIYSCLWEPDRIRFFTDGVLIQDIKLNDWMQQFFREPMFMIINNAVDHRYLNCIKPEFLPCDFEVDWVRVYQIQPAVTR